jgi:alpha-1,6-mannosyltransferase
VLVDSVFWGTWVYPEGHVFYFNAILNKSVEWGVSPWHAYFTTHLPKLLSGSIVCLAYGIYYDLETGRRLLGYGAPCLVYVIAYSFLGHKEWRFIAYVVPMLNVISAMGLARLCVF